MTPPQPPEREPYERQLFVADRPVRSDFGRSGATRRGGTDAARERVYARRRFFTVTVLVLAVAGVAYAIWGHHSTPGEIPTIMAESGYRNKPANPGGIDIPNQDVAIYNQLKDSSTPPLPVEHLLPPPEMPDASAHPESFATPPPAVASPASTVEPAPTADAAKPAAPPPVTPALVATTVAPVPTPAPAPVAAPVTAPAAAPEAAVVAPAPVAPPSAPKQVLSPPPPPPSQSQPPSQPQPPVETKATPSMPAVKTGGVVVQLASVPGESHARDLMKKLQQQYAAALQGVSLHLTRADLGKRGVYYRIQSQGLSEEAANHLCSALKQKNAGCILVRK
ncbi:MAG: SPOR domain-containing protein [Alphaproteobacteria bacterium]|nr:SPOR domain-containing protein [Alphaproteobacteria bacterium]